MSREQQQQQRNNERIVKTLIFVTVDTCRWHRIAEHITRTKRERERETTRERTFESIFSIPHQNDVKHFILILFKRRWLASRTSTTSN